jgi:hypothetical protein
VKHHVASCGLLLKIQHGDQVGLIHQSAKEYLLRKNKDAKPDLEFFRVKRGPGHLEIAMTCLDYLQNGALTDGPLTDEDVDEGRNSPRIKHAPLLLYAALHWQEHAKLLSVSEAIFDLSHPFYRRESRVRAAWLETYWRLTKRTPRNLERVATDPPTSAPDETLPPLLKPVFQNASRQKESKLQMAWMEFSGRRKREHYGLLKMTRPCQSDIRRYYTWLRILVSSLWLRKFYRHEHRESQAPILLISTKETGLDGQPYITLRTTEKKPW